MNNRWRAGVSARPGPRVIVRGGGGSWWEDGAASSARETAINRRSHQDIIAAETILSVASNTEPGLAVRTVSDELVAARRARIGEILAHHPHACLTCAQAEGCPRTQCSTGVPEEERCCSKFGNCELQDVADYVGIPPGTSRYVPAGLESTTDEPLYERHPELCIACRLCVVACEDGAHQCIHPPGVAPEPGHVAPMAEVAAKRAAEAAPDAPYRIPWVDETECVGCNLCALVCPVPGCIEMVERRRAPEPETWNDRIARGTNVVPGGLEDLP